MILIRTRDVRIAVNIREKISFSFRFTAYVFGPLFPQGSAFTLPLTSALPGSLWCLLCALPICAEPGGAMGDTISQNE